MLETCFRSLISYTYISGWHPPLGPFPPPVTYAKFFLPEVLPKIWVHHSIFHPKVTQERVLDLWFAVHVPQIAVFISPDGFPPSPGQLGFLPIFHLCEKISNDGFRNSISGLKAS